MYSDNFITDSKFRIKILNEELKMYQAMLISNLLLFYLVKISTYIFN